MAPHDEQHGKTQWEGPLVALRLGNVLLGLFGAAVSLGSASLLLGSRTWGVPAVAAVGTWLVVRAVYWAARRRAGVSGPPFGRAGTFPKFARVVVIGMLIAGVVAALLCGSAAGIGAAITGRPVGGNVLRGALFGALLGVAAMLLVLLQALAAAALDRWFPRHQEVAWIALSAGVTSGRSACSLFGGATLALIAIAVVEQMPMSAACAVSGVVATIYTATRLRAALAAGPAPRRYRK